MKIEIKILVRPKIHLQIHIEKNFEIFTGSIGHDQVALNISRKFCMNFLGAKVTYAND